MLCCAIDVPKHFEGVQQGVVVLLGALIVLCRNLRFLLLLARSSFGKEICIQQFGIGLVNQVNEVFREEAQ